MKYMKVIYRYILSFYALSFECRPRKKSPSRHGDYFRELINSVPQQENKIKKYDVTRKWQVD